MMSRRLYLDDSYCRECDGAVVAVDGAACALSQTVFHPGGGGQPHDRGTLVVRGEPVAVTVVREGSDGLIWHEVARPLELGDEVRAVLDWSFRFELMRHHALMHIVNTVARDRFDGAITGAQLGVERSRIDLKLDGFGREQLGVFEAEVNAVIAKRLAIASSVISEEEFRARPELVRTLNVAPPVVDGAVRIVEISGYDAQACGGTHVHSTGEIGEARLVKFDNKGRDNKRFYWELR
ncbi:Ser-tRNA(Ala) deacylase [Labilithrix luteola]|uniref:Ser-tRNA(Ala) deacylase n=1 Tax=Labilithrix luteola TaxID=1391654 RepID=A0A0K1PNH7_9BACT|nr:alanyl-tRNA editing protein [Labilithrix luteola]AKU95095.1 Ser-tRNA(Ala) deacylase [Labilithrix luteola]